MVIIRKKIVSFQTNPTPIAIGPGKWKARASENLLAKWLPHSDAIPSRHIERIRS